MMMKNAIRSAIIAGAILLAAAAPGRAQLSQSSVDNDIQTQLQSCGNGCNTAASLRALLNIIVQATFQSQGANGLGISGTPSAGSMLVATDATHAVWGTSYTATSLNGVPMNTDPFTVTANLFGELRFEDNGSQGASFATIFNPGSGYGASTSGFVSPDTVNCSVLPVVAVSANSSGQVITVGNGGVPTVEGVCGNGDNFPSSITTWHVVSGTLTAGTGLRILLVPMVFSGFGGHCASDTTRVLSTDLANDTGPRFYIECTGTNVFGPGDGTADLSTLRCGVGIYCVNGQVDLFSMVASVVAPTVGAGQVGYGGTTVAAGSGTCPSGTVGGQTVLGCLVINVAGTARNVPFF